MADIVEKGSLYNLEVTTLETEAEFDSKVGLCIISLWLIFCSLFKSVSCAVYRQFALVFQ